PFGVGEDRQERQVVGVLPDPVGGRLACHDPAEDAVGDVGVGTHRAPWCRGTDVGAGVRIVSGSHLCTRRARTRTWTSVHGFLSRGWTPFPYRPANRSARLIASR